jgi:hypothetical protein
MAAVFEPAIHPTDKGFLREIRDEVAVAESQEGVCRFMAKESVEFVDLQVHHGSMFLRLGVAIV